MKAALATIAVFLMFTVGASAATTASTLYVAAGGNDANSCTQSAPCLSFARAATVASSGDTIEVTGTLGNQYFAGGAGAAQGDINKTLLFRGQPGNKVRAIHIGSGDFTFDGLNLDLDGGTLPGGVAQFENGGSPVTFRNGSIGDTRDTKGALIDGPGVVFENVQFHDIVLVTSGVHTECIQALWVPRLRITGSTFTNCAVMGLSLGYPNYWNPAPPPYDGVVLENNRFNQTVPSNNYALAIWSNRYTGSCTTGCDFGAMHNYRITGNYVYSLINRQYPDSTTVVCGNTGNVPASWSVACESSPATTTTTTTEPTPTTTEPPPAEYHPACEPTCDEQILTQTARADALAGQVTELQGKIDRALADLAP